MVYCALDILRDGEKLRELGTEKECTLEKRCSRNIRDLVHSGIFDISAENWEATSWTGFDAETENRRNNDPFDRYCAEITDEQSVETLR